MRVKVIRRFPDINRPGFEFSKWNRQFETHNVILNGNYSDIYYPVHWTPLSMKCAFGGTEYYNTPRVNFGVNDNCFLILNEGALYESRISSENRVESFTINFNRNFARDVFRALSGCTEFLLDNPEHDDNQSSIFFEQLYPHDPISINILNRLRSRVKTIVPDEMEINEILHGLLEYMYTANKSALVKAKEISKVKYSTRIELYKRLTAAKDYIYSNYSTKADINLLSKISCLSPHHFLRSFKEAFHVTPHRMLRERRISEAERLLINTEKTVSEICTLVGFESLSSFGAIFKKIKGSSPEYFRKEFKKAILKQ